MGHPRDAVQRLEKPTPFLAQRRQLLLAFGRQVVVTALAPAFGFFHFPVTQPRFSIR